MSAMDELIAYFRRCLDEDERVARQMTAGPTSSGFYLEPETAATDMMAVAAHVYRWSPARVLAEVKAKRRILDAILPEVVNLEETIHGEFSSYPEVDVPDLLLKTLAQPFAGREGWREEWALDTQSDGS